MVTQKKIAHMLNLSPGTVSRALRGLPGLDPDTRAKILDTAAKMDYRLKEHTGEIEPKSSGQIISIFVDAAPVACGADGIFIQFLKGASEAARGLDISLSIDYHTDESKQELLSRVNHCPVLRDGIAKGVLLVGLYPYKVVQYLSEQYTVVRLNIREENLKIDCILQDDQHATGLLFNYLVNHTHKSIGFFCANQDMQYTFCRSRFVSYMENTYLNEMPLSDSNWIGVKAEEGVEESANKIANLIHQGVTGWICANDHWAYEMVSALSKKGLQNQRDYEICGYDAITPQLGFSQICSIRWPFEAMGKAAVRQLDYRLKNQSGSIYSQVFQGELVLPENND